MIVITGAYGFIGSCLVSRLNELGEEDIIIVDDFSQDQKSRNLLGKQFVQKIERKDFLEFFKKRHNDISFVFHLGARTDTTEQNTLIFDELNFHFSKVIWEICTENAIPLVYASSAATYGDGTLGFDDSHDKIPLLKPLNPYAISKQQFDEWALLQSDTPPLWAGLKFFNVYGPNEYHKGRMASVILHSFNTIKNTGKMKLFKSHREGIADGMQSRDFIYVNDIINICLHFFDNKNTSSGIYNAGTGKARSFLDLTLQTFKAMSLEPNIEFIDTPQDIRESYQYFTEAKMDKLFSIGFDKTFTSLEDGVEEYVKNYLMKL
jgi:ADP-L-glycero-D-manno-heptose 6-epimerase